MTAHQTRTSSAGTGPRTLHEREWRGWSGGGGVEEEDGGGGVEEVEWRGGWSGGGGRGKSAWEMSS